MMIIEFLMDFCPFLTSFETRANCAKLQISSYFVKKNFLSEKVEFIKWLKIHHRSIFRRENMCIRNDDVEYVENAYTVLNISYFSIWKYRYLTTKSLVIRFRYTIQIELMNFFSHNEIEVNPMKCRIWTQMIRWKQFMNTYWAQIQPAIIYFNKRNLNRVWAVEHICMYFCFCTWHRNKLKPISEINTDIGNW